MQSSECENMDDKIEQAPKDNGHHTPEKRWSPEVPHPGSLPISPNDQETFDTISENTDPAAPIVTYQDQEIQCDFVGKGKETVQTPNEESLPTGSRLAILVVCTCMAIFLQALVSQRDIVSENHR